MPKVRASAVAPPRRKPKQVSTATEGGNSAEEWLDGDDLFRGQPPIGICAPIGPARQLSIISNSHRATIVKQALEDAGYCVGQVRKLNLRSPTSFIQIDPSRSIVPGLNNGLDHTDLSIKRSIRRCLRAVHIEVDDLLVIGGRMLVPFIDEVGANEEIQAARSRTKQPAAAPAKRRAKLPADLVEETGRKIPILHKELAVLKEYMVANHYLDDRVPKTPEELESLLKEQFRDLKSSRPRSSVINIVNKTIKTHPHLKNALLEKLPKSRQFMWLAKELCAAILGEPLPRIKEAWYQSQNNESKASKLTKTT
jgi:hypothetical protein